MSQPATIMHDRCRASQTTLALQPAHPDDTSLLPSAPQVFPFIDLYYRYFRKGCCDEGCEFRLRSLAAMHLRGIHYKARRRPAMPQGQGG